MRRIILALFVVGGLVATSQAWAKSPFQLLSTDVPAITASASADAGIVTPVVYPYGYYYGPYGGYYRPYGTYYRGYGYGYPYGGYYRPYYTRGWRDGYILPLGRRWGLF